MALKDLSYANLPPFDGPDFGEQIRRMTRELEERARAPFRAELKNATLIIASLVRQLGGTARVSRADMEREEGSIAVRWADSYSDELVIEVKP